MPAGANAPGPEQKRLFLEGGGTFCQREKVPPPSNSLPLPARFIRTNFSANDGTVLNCCKHAVIRRPGTCRDAVKRWCCTRPEVPSSGMVLPAGQARQKPFAPRPGAASLPVYGSIPPNRYSPASSLSTTFFLRSLNQPIGFLPLCGNAPVPPFAHEGCRRRPQAPAQKKRNFLDLWQTIAQDLSRLFAVPGGCPSCPGSRKGWPEPLSRFRRPVPVPSLLPAAFRKELCAVWPEHDA